MCGPCMWQSHGVVRRCMYIVCIVLTAWRPGPRVCMPGLQVWLTGLQPETHWDRRPRCTMSVADGSGALRAEAGAAPPPRRLMRKTAPQQAPSYGLPHAEAVPKRRRLTGKTIVQQGSWSGPSGDEIADAHRAVYLITFSHPQQRHSADGRALVAPEAFTREGIALAVRDAAARPMHSARWLRQHPDHVVRPNDIDMLTVFREFHAEADGTRGHVHYHVAILFAQDHRFAPMKNALLWANGLASHWSCSHTGYWSAVRYGRVPRPTKPQAALDPAPFTWAAAGPHPPLDACVHEPTCAKALEARRTRVEHAASAAGKGAPHVREVDVWPVVVASGVRVDGGSQLAEKRLIRYAKAHCSDPMVAFLFKNRHRLAGLIRDAWAWEEVDTAIATAEMSRTDILHAACSSACQCGGAWLQQVQMSFAANGIDAPELCHHVLQALERGRHESVKVVVLLGRQGGEGKSLFFQPLTPLFGHDAVQRNPQAGRFPLMGLDSKRIVVLDEWHFDPDILPLATQLLWFEGKPITIALPQNIAGQSGHMDYTSDAPIFITAPEEVLRNMAGNAFAPPTGQWSMLLRRLKLFHFTVPIPEPREPIVPCTSCFSLFLTQKAREWRTGA